MNYSPKHNDTKIRIIYATLILAGLCMNLMGDGIVKTVLSALSLAFIATGLYLFIRCDLTTFTYIVMENEGRLDFYVDKITGKRGSYVCYYPVSDCVLIKEYKKGTKKSLYQEYGKIFVYNYCHNRLSGEKQILVFKNDGYYDAVICELDARSLSYLKNII